MNAWRYFSAAQLVCLSLWTGAVPDLQADERQARDVVAATPLRE